MKNIKAVVDIGTNSVRLLIAEKFSASTYKILCYKAKITRLGEGIGSEKILRPKAVERTLDAVVNYHKEVGRWGAELISIIGTSAVRDAANKDSFIEKIRENTGFEMKVLSGSEEARLSYLGVVKSLPGLDEEGLLIFDLGGGSTEFIWQAEDKIHLESFDLGAVRLTEIFITTDPPSPGELKEMEKHIRFFLSSFKKKTGKVKKLIGAGGTIASLVTVKQELKKFNPQKVHGYTLKREEVNLLLKKLVSLEVTERKNLPGLHPQRADVIIAGTAVVKNIMETYKLTEVTASQGDLLLGALHYF